MICLCGMPVARPLPDHFPTCVNGHTQGGVLMSELEILRVRRKGTGRPLSTDRDDRIGRWESILAQFRKWGVPLMTISRWLFDSEQRIYVLKLGTMTDDDERTALNALSEWEQGGITRDYLVANYGSTRDQKKMRRQSIV